MTEAVAPKPDPNDMSTWPADLRDMVLARIAEDDEMRRHYLEDYDFKVIDGIVHEEPKAGCPTSGSQGPIHSYFGLSYASWLVLPRLTLQEMPKNWQARFVALLEEAEDLGILHRPETKVTVIGDDGKYVEGAHWHNYRRGTVAGALATDREREKWRLYRKEQKRLARLAEIERRIAESNAKVLADQ